MGDNETTTNAVRSIRKIPLAKCFRKWYSGCTEILVVVPESILRRLVDTGVHPLKAKMVEVQQLTDPDRETIAKNQVWRFTGFERVISYVIQTEEV